MPIIPKKHHIIEETVPVYNIDPMVCKEKLKGDIDEHGTCLVRIKTDSDDPNRAELLRMIYFGGRGAKPPAYHPQEGTQAP